MSVKIIGTGSYLPETVVTNDDLAQIMDTSDEWIQSRTGIRERRIVKEETLVSMSAKAAIAACENAGISPEDVDLILLGTVSGDYVTPSNACLVQAEIGAKTAIAYDINAACSGFMYGMQSAYAYLQAGIYKKAVVIGAEVLSRIINWSDRSTCVLFGDGAGAAVLAIDDDNEAGGILSFDLGTDGSKGMVLSCVNRLNNNPYVKNSTELDFVQMNGQEVYKFAVKTVPASIERALKKCCLKAEDVDYFVLHQANIRIIQAVAKRLDAPEEKFPISLDHVGNISAASVPVLLDEMNRKGMLKKGNKLAMSGFGAGLTWGTTVLEWSI